jgi:tetrapyrrole methylase family protein/MazG family protein
MSLIEGISLIEKTVAVLGLKDSSQLTLLDAQYLHDKHYPPFPPDVPVVITGLRTMELAERVKAVLRIVYPGQHPVKLVYFNLDNAQDVSSPPIETIALDVLDQCQYLGSTTNLFVPPLAADTSFEAFQEIVAHLRAPDGCPWDRKQTHESLRSHLISETYEVLSALDAKNNADICEEFGDLLLQIVLHAQIAAEAGEFGMPDVTHGIHTKIVRRHPHVFGDLDIHDVDGVLRNWESLKAKERATSGKNTDNGEKPKGLLDGVPLALPALIQSQEYQERVERVGFPLAEMRAALGKVQAALSNLEANEVPIHADQIGDLLFEVVGLAAVIKVDAESALREANTRLRMRVSALEKQAHMEGRPLGDLAKERQGIL